MSTTVTITVDGQVSAGSTQGASGDTPSAGQAPSMEPPRADTATSTTTDDGAPTLLPQDVGADDAADTDPSGEPPDPSVVVDDDPTATADEADLAPEPSIEPS
ncbi:MAG: hypothetical protein WA966_02645 [Ornithinimicrobium sp.]